MGQNNFDRTVILQEARTYLGTIDKHILEGFDNLYVAWMNSRSDAGYHSMINLAGAYGYTHYNTLGGKYDVSDDTNKKDGYSDHTPQFTD